MTKKEIDYKGFKIEIWYDEDLTFDFFDHLGKFYTNCPRDLNPCNAKIQEILDEDDRIDENYIYVPVYAYIHSGVALSLGRFSDPWDSGFGGVMATTMDEVKKWYGKEIPTKEKIIEHLKGDVHELNSFCQGEVYGYTVYDEDDEEIDSCGGYVGDMDYVINEAETRIDCKINKYYKEAFVESMMYADAE